MTMSSDPAEFGGKPSAFEAVAIMALPEGPGEGVPEWVHLLPAGTFMAKDGRGPFHLDNADAVVRATQEYAGTRKLPIDYDHQIENTKKNGQPAIAAGWISGLQVRSNGIWAKVEWTERAAQHIAAKEYRYLSPVFGHTKDTKRVTVIAHAGLTNTPALDDLVAVASREPPMDNQAETFLSDLRAMLSLPESASTADVLDAVKALQATSSEAAMSAVQPDPAAFVPIGEFKKLASEYNKLNQGMTEEASREHVESQIRAGNMAPFLRNWGIQLCSINRVAYDAFVTETKGFFNGIFDRQGRPGLPPSKRGGTLSETELEVCTRMGISETDYRNAIAFNSASED